VFFTLLLEPTANPFFVEGRAKRFLRTPHDATDDFVDGRAERFFPTPHDAIDDVADARTHVLYRALVILTTHIRPSEPFRVVPEGKSRTFVDGALLTPSRFVDRFRASDARAGFFGDARFSAVETTRFQRWTP
jgi:hypothetical protein